MAEDTKTKDLLKALIQWKKLVDQYPELLKDKKISKRYEQYQKLQVITKKVVKNEMAGVVREQGGGGIDIEKVIKEQNKRLPASYRDHVKVDMSADDFWKGVRKIARQNMMDVVLEAQDNGIQNFETYLRKEGGGKAGLELVVSILAIIPNPQANLAGAILDGVIKSYEFLKDKVQEQVDFENFIVDARDSVEKARGQINNYQGKLFDYIARAKSWVDGDDGIIDPRGGFDAKLEEFYRKRADFLLSLKRDFDNAPKSTKHLEWMTLAWIKQSTDSYDLDGKYKAGYVYWEVVYYEAKDKFEFIKFKEEDGALVGLTGLAISYLRDEGRPMIDDVSRPEGVKAALTKAFGAKKPLHDLPLNMELRISRKTVEGSGDDADTDFSTWTYYKNDKPGLQHFKLSEGTWLTSTGNELLEIWKSRGPKPTIEDLVND